MDKTVSIIIHIIIVLVLIALFAYAIYYINKYNETNNSLQGCTSSLQASETIITDYRRLPIPMSAILNNVTSSTLPPIYLTYDATGKTILAPIAVDPNDPNSTKNIGLITRTFTSSDPLWNVSRVNNNIIIMDSSKTMFIVAQSLTSGTELILSTNTTNNTFAVTTDLNSSLSPVGDDSLYVFSDNSVTNKLLKLSNTQALATTLYGISIY